MTRVIRFLARPRTFFAGVLLGILACVLAGRHVATVSYYEDFVRIGAAYSNSPGFFVTASQTSALIRKTCRKDQVLVVAGGSSVIMGAGQPIRHLWTKKLQEILGPDYCVFNLASPAGTLVGYASVSLEMVGKEFKDAFLVVDTVTPPVQMDGHLWYKYFFWDALYKGMLKDGPIQYNEAVLNKIRASHDASPLKARTRIEQVRTGMWLDSFLYFNDLWTFVHYTFVQTVYDPGIRSSNWKPRRTLTRTDYDFEIDEAQIRSLKHYPPPESTQFADEFRVVNRFRRRLFNTDKARETPGDRAIEERFSEISTTIGQFPLTAMAGKVFVTMIPESPYYTQRLAENDRRDYFEILKRYAQAWESNGYRTVSMLDLGPEDYADRVHVNTLGGWKLAEKVAEAIRSKSSPSR